MQRFWAMVNKHGPTMPHMKTRCWIWTGCVAGKMGYGGFRFGKLQLAHRVAFFLKHGRWPKPCACHHCDNPLCIRWSHLFEGTKADNNKDMLAKDRQVRGADHGKSVLTPAAVKRIRLRTNMGDSQRKIANNEGVSQAAVRDVLSGRCWAHIVN